MSEYDNIKKRRRALDEITKELIILIRKRNKIALEIGRSKRRLGLKIIDSRREKDVMEKAIKAAKRAGVSTALVKKILLLLIREGRGKQKKVAV